MLFVGVAFFFVFIFFFFFGGGERAHLSKSSISIKKM